MRFEIQLEDLNEDLQILAEVCGMDAVQLLLEKLPGVQLFIPKRWNPQNRDLQLISQFCGEEIARRIWEECAGMVFVIPKKPFRNRIRKQIREEYQKGASAKYLAIKYGVSISGVYNIVRNTA